MTRTRSTARPGRHRMAVAVGVATLLALAGCGNDDGDTGTTTGGSAAGDETVSITVGVIPIIDVAPLYLGVEQGFFEERGLELDMQLAAGGAAIVPAVLSGSNQFGFSNNVSLIAAASRQVPVRIVAPGVNISPETTSGAGGDTGYCEVIVPADSDIAGPEQLVGATVAVNTLNNIGDVTIRAALEDQGIDHTGVQFTEMPFPDMVTALESDRIDAAWACEPFVTQLIGGGARGVLNNYGQTDPNLSVASYFTSAEFAEQNPDVVRRFVEALEESLEYAQANPDEARDAVTQYTQMSADVVDTLGLPDWSAEFNRPSIERLVELSERYGVIESSVSLDDLILTQD